VAAAVLHRYSNLDFFWRQVSKAERPQELSALMEGFFPLR
jgi:hypothetical protein